MRVQTKQQRDAWLDEHNRRSLAELDEQKRKAANAAKKVGVWLLARLCACTSFSIPGKAAPHAEMFIMLRLLHTYCHRRCHPCQPYYALLLEHSANVCENPAD